MASPEAVTSSIQTDVQVRPVSKALPGAADLNELLESQGIALKVRRRQRVAAGSPDMVFYVKSGLLVLCANASSERRQLLSLLYPGDVFSMDQAPPLDGIDLIAMTDCELIRLRRSAVEQDPQEALVLDRYMAECTFNMYARATLHIARLASLPSEPRVAAFILELALRMGRVSNDQVSCDLPLSRTDIADYLSLNADTLSRIMTRLKERGTIATIGRSRTIVKSVKRLCEEVPVCVATMALHSQGQTEAD